MFRNHVFRKSRENAEHAVFSEQHDSIFYFFCMQIFSISCTFYIFNSESDTLHILFFKSWHVIKFSFKICCVANILFKVWHFVNAWNRNLMHLKVFISKSNSSYVKKIKTIHELKFWYQNLTGYNGLSSKLVLNFFFGSSLRFVTWKKDAMTVKFSILF